MPQATIKLHLPQNLATRTYLGIDKKLAHTAKKRVASWVCQYSKPLLLWDLYEPNDLGVQLQGSRSPKTANTKVASSLPFRFKSGGDGNSSGSGSSMAPEQHHHRSTTKQAQKPFKSRHATKSALKERSKGTSLWVSHFSFPSYPSTPPSISRFRSRRKLTLYPSDTQAR